MDPQACLRRAADAIDRGDLFEARAALDDYAAWRARSGYEPPGGDQCARELRLRIQQEWLRRDQDGPKPVGESIDEVLLEQRLLRQLDDESGDG